MAVTNTRICSNAIQPNVADSTTLQPQSVSTTTTSCLNGDDVAAMSNATDPSALSVHGVNPQHLIEKIMRNRIYASVYWKEQCFGLTSETLVDKAIELAYIGGTFGGNQQPTPFLCLLLKMLQLQPEIEVVREFIQNEEYKCVLRVHVMLSRCHSVERACPRCVDARADTLHCGRLL